MATGVVKAYKPIGNIPVLIILRLQGTNAAEGARIINESGLKVQSAVALSETAEKVREVVTAQGSEELPVYAAALQGDNFDQPTFVIDPVIQNNLPVYYAFTTSGQVG